MFASPWPTTVELYQLFFVLRIGIACPQLLCHHCVVMYCMGWTSNKVGFLVISTMTSYPVSILNCDNMITICFNSCRTVNHMVQNKHVKKYPGHYVLSWLIRHRFFKFLSSQVEQPLVLVCPPGDPPHLEAQLAAPKAADAGLVPGLERQNSYEVSISQLQYVTSILANWI